MSTHALWAHAHLGIFTCPKLHKPDVPVAQVGVNSILDLCYKLSLNYLYKLRCYRFYSSDQRNNLPCITVNGSKFFINNQSTENIRSRFEQGPEFLKRRSDLNQSRFSPRNGRIWLEQIVEERNYFGCKFVSNFAAQERPARIFSRQNFVSLSAHYIQAVNVTVFTLGGGGHGDYEALKGHSEMIKSSVGKGSKTMLDFETDLLSFLFRYPRRIDSFKGSFSCQDMLQILNS